MKDRHIDKLLGAFRRRKILLFPQIKNAEFLLSDNILKFSESHINPIRIVCFGSMYLWIYLLFFGRIPSDNLFLEGGINLVFLCFMGTLSISLIAFGLLPSRLTDRLFSGEPEKWIAAALFILGTASLVFFHYQSLLPLGVVGSVLSTIGLAMLFLMYGKLFSSITPVISSCEIVLSYIISATFFLLFPESPSSLTIVAIVLSVIFSVAGLWIPVMPRKTTSDHLNLRQNRFIPKIILAAFIFSFIEGQSREILQSTYGVVLYVGTILAGVVIFLMLLFSQSVKYELIWRPTVLVMCLGCLSLPFLSNAPEMASVILRLGFSSFDILLWMMLVTVGYNFHASTIRLIGLGRGVLFGGVLLGRVFVEVFVPIISYEPYSFPFYTFLAAIMVASLLLVYSSILPEKTIGDLAPPEAPEDKLDNEMFQGLCQKHQLTTRECEILAFVLKGRSIARTQEEFHISKGTVNTHLRHIYAKLGVHNRQELLDWFEQNKEHSGL